MANKFFLFFFIVLTTDLFRTNVLTVTFLFFSFQLSVRHLSTRPSSQIVENPYKPTDKDEYEFGKHFTLEKETLKECTFSVHLSLLLHINHNNYTSKHVKHTFWISSIQRYITLQVSRVRGKELLALHKEKFISQTPKSVSYQRVALKKQWVF
jgi:hypothetical protein